MGTVCYLQSVMNLVEYSATLLEWKWRRLLNALSGCGRRALSGLPLFPPLLFAILPMRLHL